MTAFPDVTPKIERSPWPKFGFPKLLLQILKGITRHANTHCR